jgi:hypothetical protein
MKQRLIIFTTKNIHDSNSYQHKLNMITQYWLLPAFFEELIPTNWEVFVLTKTAWWS